MTGEKLKGDSVEKLQMTCTGCDGRGAFSLNQAALTHTFVHRSVGHVRWLGLWERGGRQWVAWSSDPHCEGWDATKVASSPCIMMWCEVKLVNQQDVPWWNFKLSSTSDLEISSKLQSGDCYSGCTPLPKPISGGSGTESSSSRRRQEQAYQRPERVLPFRK